LATKIVSEIDSYSSSFHFKIGFFSILIFFLITSFYQSSDNSNKEIKFKSIFNYVEGISVGTDIEMAGLKIGIVDKISLNQNNEVVVEGIIDPLIDIPDDSILLIRSNGIFGKKSLLIEPGFGDIIENESYLFTDTKDSYSIDMFLRYLGNLNE
tara:strand:- start:1960 stop:2421 length:462 start_codon:yes stop_codon:yes gene_type:complete